MPGSKRVTTKRKRDDLKGMLLPPLQDADLFPAERMASPSELKTEALSIRNILYATRLMKSCRSYSCKDLEESYTKATIALAQMCFVAGDVLRIRDSFTVRPDMVLFRNHDGALMWSTCLSISFGKRKPLRIYNMHIRGNAVELTADSMTFVFRFGANLDSLYAQFEKCCPTEPKDNICWNLEIDPRSIWYVEGCGRTLTSEKTRMAITFSEAETSKMMQKTRERYPDACGIIVDLPKPSVTPDDGEKRDKGDNG